MHLDCSDSVMSNTLILKITSKTWTKILTPSNLPDPILVKKIFDAMAETINDKMLHDDLQWTSPKYGEGLVSILINQTKS